MQDGSIYLTDKSSANGTTVNGTKITSDIEVSINRGDKVTFGGVADLDWNRIPIVPVIDSTIWDVYTIGVDYRNRVKLIDNTNKASRFHAMLKVDKKSGKCYVVDYSSNGTFANGQRVNKNQDTLIKYQSDLKFANIPFDWSKMKRPESNAVKNIAIIAALIAVVIGGLFGYNKLHKWNLDDIQRNYGDAIVFVRHDFQVRAELFSGEVYALAINESGLPLFIDPEGTNDIEQYEPVFRSIESISSADNDYFTVTTNGTAFFVDNKGTMATNRHITKPWESNIDSYKAAFEKRYSDLKRIYGYTTFIGIAKNNVSVSISESSRSDFLECSIINTETDSRSKDVGLIRTKINKTVSDNGRYIKLNKAVYDSEKLTPGSTIFYIGYPLGTTMFKIIDDNKNTNTHDIRQSPQQGVITQNPDKYKFGHNAPSYGGASGSPIFNEKGKLVGIHNSGMSSTGIHGFNWGILAKHLKELYDEEFE